MSLKFTIDRREDNKAYGTLTWAEKDLRCGAVSGPYGKRELPDGLYRVKRNDLLDKPKDSPYCDSLQSCWFQLISPQFSTHRKELGIHPDGNKIGTLGCIGLIDADTSAWYEAFKSIQNGTYSVLEVIDRAK